MKEDNGCCEPEKMLHFPVHDESIYGDEKIADNSSASAPAGINFRGQVLSFETNRSLYLSKSFLVRTFSLA